MNTIQGGQRLKVHLPLLIQDPWTSKEEGLPLLTNFIPAHEDFFLDGPVSKRLAVLDFSRTTGELLKGAKIKKSSSEAEEAWYSGTKMLLPKHTGNSSSYRGKIKEQRYYSPSFIQTSVFATVLRTMYLFEGRMSIYFPDLYPEIPKKEDIEKNFMGRSLFWSFSSPQLLIIPRAGEQANAFYHRDSHSLQFFFFRSPKNPRKVIYTCLSRDIVAHETAHAILDGIAPDLLDTCTPQSLAIHEAIADLTALIMSFYCPFQLLQIILKRTEGSLKSSTLFTSIAEEFGQELYPERKYLRDLYNDKNLNPKDNTNFVPSDQPHALSEVLSGALYQILINIYEKEKLNMSKFSDFSYGDFFSESLIVAKDVFSRLIFRALDFLPPGEIGFADYGRAIIASDQIANPNDKEIRDWIIKEFVKRHIVADEKALQIEKNFDEHALKTVKISDLYSSDWVAYDFANKNKDLFCIPVGKEPVPFEVRPRLSVNKFYFSGSRGSGHELIFKISWHHEEPNPIGSGFPPKRAITVGTTLVIDWETKRILARLTSAPSPKDGIKDNEQDGQQRELARKENLKQRKARDKYLRHLAEEGYLEVGRYGVDPTGKPLNSLVIAEVSGDKMHVRNTGNMLHIVGRGADL